MDRFKIRRWGWRGRGEEKEHGKSVGLTVERTLQNSGQPLTPSIPYTLCDTPSISTPIPLFPTFYKTRGLSVLAMGFLSTRPDQTGPDETKRWPLELEPRFKRTRIDKGNEKRRRPKRKKNKRNKNLSKVSFNEINGNKKERLKSKSRFARPINLRRVRFLRFFDWQSRTEERGTER